MARIVRTIEIEGCPAVALFDTEAPYSYVRTALVNKAAKSRMARPVTVGLGGRSMRIREQCFLEGKIEGLPLRTDAVPFERLGQADRRELDVLIGARTLEQWQLRLDPASGTLDLEGLRRREFTEFGSFDSRPHSEPARTVARSRTGQAATACHPNRQGTPAMALARGDYLP